MGDTRALGCSSDTPNPPRPVCSIVEIGAKARVWDFRV